MEFNELIQKRYSVRAYQSKPVEEAKLRQILEAANWAPTAANRQPFKIVVIQTRGKEAELKRLYHRDWFSQAPLVIGICAVTSEAWSRMDGKNYAEVDATIAMDHLILAAANLGLGTCWVAAFNPDVAREMLALPPDVEPIAFTPLGYPADEPKPKKRKSLSDLVRYEKW
ncbi:MAG: nitroreductase family protein [candidate division KSB1 bacterium]|nr:nitroreductase family protein [candidate division KSB1 bacterium]MDZ7340367.1 nitroreductase family protein [candidate division KSB1 bacterium]